MAKPTVLLHRTKNVRKQNTKNKNKLQNTNAKSQRLAEDKRYVKLTADLTVSNI